MSVDPHRIRSVEELEQRIGTSKLVRDPQDYRSLDRFALDFIARCPFIVLSTASRDGAQDVSPKGDAPGFVQVVDERTLLIPDRPGNKLAYGHRNILENPRVGILFMIPGTSETLRVGGQAELTADPALRERMAARGRPAELVIRVHVDECFFHCAKAFLRSRLWDPERRGAPYRVSLGAWVAHKTSADSRVADQIEGMVQESYRTEL